jgi:hypothetical protein
VPWATPPDRPDLGCFALRLAIEEQRPDGTFRPVSGKQALRVKPR